MTVTHTDLSVICHEIWAAVVGIDLHPATDGSSHEAHARVVSGTVQITGDWTGAVTVQVEEPFARTLAASLFMLEVDEVSEEEVMDTVGELANMTGGNVKSTLGGSCELSLPSVTSGRDYRFSVPGSGVKERIAFDANGELVFVTLLERESASSG